MLHLLVDSAVDSALAKKQAKVNKNSEVRFGIMDFYIMRFLRLSFQSHLQCLYDSLVGSGKGKIYFKGREDLLQSPMKIYFPGKGSTTTRLHGMFTRKWSDNYRALLVLVESI